MVLLRSAVLCSTAIQVHGLRRLLWAWTSRDSANAIRSPTRTNSTPVIQRTNRIEIESHNATLFFKACACRFKRVQERLAFYCVPRFFGLPKCPCARQQLESQNSTSLDITLYEHKEHNKLQHPFLEGEGSNWKVKRQDWRNSGAISTLSLKDMCGMSLQHPAISTYCRLGGDGGRWWERRNHLNSKPSWANYLHFHVRWSWGLCQGRGWRGGWGRWRGHLATIDANMHGTGATRPQNDILTPHVQRGTWNLRNDRCDLKLDPLFFSSFQMISTVLAWQIDDDDDEAG